MKKTTSIFFTFFLLLSGACSAIPAANDMYICPPCGDGSCDKMVYSEPGNCPTCGMALVPQGKQKNVAVFVYDGMEILDFSGPSEVFASAGTDIVSFRVFTVAVSKNAIVSQGFIKIQPEFSLADCPEPDIIVLPGGSTGPSVENPDVIAWVKKHAAHAEAVMSVCTGAFILEKAGLLAGKKATTFHGAIGRLREKATQTEVLDNVRWVDNGQVVTTAGVSAGIDGALHIVERMLGRDAAQETAHYMEYDKWKPEDGVIVTASEEAKRK